MTPLRVAISRHLTNKCQLSSADVKLEKRRQKEKKVKRREIKLMCKKSIYVGK